MNQTYVVSWNCFCQMYRSSSNSSTHHARSHQKLTSTTASNSKHVFLNREDHCVYVPHDGNTTAYSDKNVCTILLRNCSHSSQYQTWVWRLNRSITHLVLNYSPLMSINLITFFWSFFLWGSCRPPLKQIFSNWEQISRERILPHSNVLTKEKVIQNFSYV
jgi:hypothetical protein